MPTGHGSSLGEAILNAIADAAGGRQEYRSYTATGWHAQLVKLTSSDRGYAAAADAGLSATSKTLREWLRYAGPEDRAPSAENQKLIRRAYERMAGRWPETQIEGKDIRIHGVVKIGSDRRERGGTSGHSALLIDGSAGNWDRIKEVWLEREQDAEDVEDYFVEDLLEADLGETTEPWSFPGTSYTVVIG